MNLNDLNLDRDIERLIKLNSQYLDELLAEINLNEIEADIQKSIKDLELDSINVSDLDLPDSNYIIDELDKLLK